jgi:NADH-ubiquinone oxidoreductase chain 4L
MGMSLWLLLIGILGFVLNRKNILLMLISLEVVLLSLTLLIVLGSMNFDDIVGQIFGVYIISVAGAESAIGLAILVAYYRLRGTVSIDYSSHSSNSWVKKSWSK